eukprot:g4130.t1
MHVHTVRSSSTNTRPGTNGIPARCFLASRQSLRSSLELTPTCWKTGRFGLRTQIWRSFNHSRFGIRYIVSASTAVEQPLSSGRNTEPQKRSELSNGPLPITIKLGELLGRGTFGAVYRGIDTATGKEFAIKVISKTRSGKDPASVNSVKERIEHEVSMWCALQNFPSAVHLERFYEDDDDNKVYLVQELCSGGSLQDLMAIRGFLSEIETVYIMTTVLSLLLYCHNRNICYLDIKPANFILPGSSQAPDLFSNSSLAAVSKDYVKVIDFGSCEYLPKNGLRGIRGTPLYSAPEVQHSRYGIESDLWSAGVMMYYLLSGEIPFIGKPDQHMSQSALDFYIAHAELKFNGPKWSQVSQEAKELISAMLDRSVKNRITAQEALEHPWIQQRGSQPVFANSFSDICPIEAPVKALKEVQPPN